MKSSSVLSHLKVIEVGSFVAGPFCGQLLADFGADVIKVEPPKTGDTMRGWGAVRASNGTSLWWSVIGRNKKSLTLDLRTKEGQEILKSLLVDTDVLVENFRPGTLEKWGLDPKTLRESKPGLIVARVSGFGQTGPNASRAGFAAVAEAAAGLRTLTGYPDRPSTRVGVSIGDSLAGLHAAFGVLLALTARDRNGGQGQDVDVAITESVLAVMESVIADFGAAGTLRQRSGPVIAGLAPSNAYPTVDGSEIVIGANTDGLFKELCGVMGNPGLTADPRFATHKARGDNQPDIDDIIGQWTQSRDKAEIISLMVQHGIPVGPVNDAAGVSTDPHFRERGAIVDVHDAEIGNVTMQGTFPVLGQTPGKINWPGPALGAHSKDILQDRLGMSASEIERLSAAGII